MEVLENSKVKDYISSLDGKSSCQHIYNVCQCIKENMPLKVHVENAIPFVNNLVEMAVFRSQNNPRSVVMYITETSYFTGQTMQLLVSKMLGSKDVETVEQFYSVLDENITMHPPCVSYMNREYEHLILKEFNYGFENMTLWDYIIDCCNRIVSGSLLYGNDKAFSLAFKKCFSLCVRILQMNFEVAKKKNLKPLIMMCTKFNPDRRTRLSEITKLLDKLFNTGYDFQIPIIDLARLVNQMMAKTI